MTARVVRDDTPEGDSPDLTPLRGSMFDFGQGLFLQPDLTRHPTEGAVYDYSDYQARDLDAMLRRDDRGLALDAVLRQPAMAARWSIVPAKGDKGEAEDALERLTRPATSGGSLTPLQLVVNQMTTARVYRKSFHELWWGLDDDGTTLLRDIAYRPASTCRARRNLLSARHAGFEQTLLVNMAVYGQKRPGGDGKPIVVAADRAVVYVHGQDRDPVGGISALEVAYWALAHGSQVQTPDGPVAIETLRPGDYVFGADGLPARVLAVHPRGERQMYRVTMKDGSSVECDTEHLWGVYDSNRGRARGQSYRVMATGDLVKAGLRRTAQSGPGWRFSIPRTAPVEYADVTLPLDPYILGAWLGDGSMALAADGERRYAPKLTSFEPDEFIANEVAARLPDDVRLVRRPVRDNGFDYSFQPVAARDTNPVRDALVGLGVGHRSTEKFIPHLYLTASVKQRWDLLRGLMDTDGSPGGAGTAHVRFYTSSKRLADDVRTLVRSLGGSAIIRAMPRSHLGKHDPYRVELITSEAPFLLPRKAEQWRPTNRYARAAIVSIEPSRVAEASCISVENLDGLFLADDYVVTHNCWRTKQKLLYLWMCYYEGVALPRTTVKSAEGEEKAREQGRKIAKAKSSGVVAVDHQTELDVLDISGKGGGQFKEGISYLDAAAANSHLAGFIDLPSQATTGSGSRALFNGASDFFLQAQQAFLRELATAATDQLVIPLTAYNHGARAAFPRFEFAPLTEQDLAPVLTLLQSFIANTDPAAPKPPRALMDELVMRGASILDLDTDAIKKDLEESAERARQQAALLGQVDPNAQRVAGTAGMVSAAVRHTQQAGLVPPPPAR